MFSIRRPNQCVMCYVVEAGGIFCPGLKKNNINNFYCKVLRKITCITATRFSPLYQLFLFVSLCTLSLCLCFSLSLFVSLSHCLCLSTLYLCHFLSPSYFFYFFPPPILLTFICLLSFCVSHTFFFLSYYPLSPHFLKFLSLGFFLLCLFLFLFLSLSTVYK